jgi:hypothetical protein
MWRHVVWFQRKFAASITLEENICSALKNNNDGCSGFLRNVDQLTSQNTVSYTRRPDLQIYHPQSLTSRVKHLFRKYFNVPRPILGMTYNFFRSMTTLKKVTWGWIGWPVGKAVTCAELPHELYCRVGLSRVCSVILCLRMSETVHHREELTSINDFNHLHNLMTSNTLCVIFLIVACCFATVRVFCLTTPTVA